MLAEILALKWNFLYILKIHPQTTQHLLAQVLIAKNIDPTFVGSFALGFRLFHRVKLVIADIFTLNDKPVIAW